MELLIIISVAIAAFIATNIDDLFLLIVFFAHPQYDTTSIIIGQYTGIISLILISIPVYIFKSSIPDFFMVLIGFIPLLIGLKEIIALYKNKTKYFIQNSNENSFNSDSSKSKNINSEGNNSDNIKLNFSKSSRNLDNNEILADEINQKTFFKDNKLNSGNYSSLAWFSVALITISNGADNIGIYAPLFSILKHSELLLTILIFLVMTGIWCFLGHLIIKNKILGIKIEKYGHMILPFVLILLGIGIILSNYLQMT